MKRYFVEIHHHTDPFQLTPGGGVETLRRRDSVNFFLSASWYLRVFSSKNASLFLQQKSRISFNVTPVLRKRSEEVRGQRSPRRKYFRVQTRWRRSMHCFLSAVLGLMSSTSLLRLPSTTLLWLCRPVVSPSTCCANPCGWCGCVDIIGC